MPLKNRVVTHAAIMTLIGAGLAQVAFAAEEEKQIEVRIHKLHEECADDDDCTAGIVIEKHGDGEPHRIRIAGLPHHRALAFRLGGGHLGVALTDLTPELRAHFGVPEDAGVLVSKVIEDSPAQAAGLEVGDVVSAVDGEEVADSGELAAAIRHRDGGDTVVLEVWRDGKLQQISATLEERENPLRQARGIHFDCGDDEDCDFDFDFDLDDLDFEHLPFVDGLDFLHADSLDSAFGCEKEDCEIDIVCSDGECSCSVDGESTECPDLPGFRFRGSRR